MVVSDVAIVGAAEVRTITGSEETSDPDIDRIADRQLGDCIKNRRVKLRTVGRTFGVDLNRSRTDRSVDVQTYVVEAVIVIAITPAGAGAKSATNRYAGSGRILRGCLGYDECTRYSCKKNSGCLTQDSTSIKKYPSRHFVLNPLNRTA